MQKRFKRIAAIVLAATMVLGSSLTAFADANTGSSEGTGTSEGHVEKKATNVVLPTVAEDATPFAYTMDPERLIAATAGEKYGDSVIFPASADDTGVYFNNGPKGGDGADKDKTVYASSSKPLTVTNKSSYDIDLTVSVAVASEDTDIPLVAQDAIADAEAASLYLGLIVGEEDAVVITTEEAVSQTVSITGTPGNFKIAVNEDGDGYEYRALTLEEYKKLDGNGSATQATYDATWDTADFQLEGAVTEDIAIEDETTAPKVTVTWSWEDPSATPVVVDADPSVTPATATSDGTEDLVITYSLGTGEGEATAVSAFTFSCETKNTVDRAVAASMYTLDAEAKTLTLPESTMSYLKRNGFDVVEFKVTFDNDKTATCTVTFTD